MTSHDRRLERLAIAYRRPDPEPKPPRWDYSCLSPPEQYEFAQLLERCRPPDPSDPHRRPDLSALTDDEVERGAELMERVIDRSPEPAA
jgi:hypothetical protein